jgi:hypothetical protein
VHVTCEDVRSTLIEGVVKRRAPTDPTMIAHLESCPECRAARADYERLWAEMGDLDAGDPSPAAGLRFRRRLAAERLVSPRPDFRRMVPTWAGAVAAAALVAGLVGFQVGTGRGRVTVDLAAQGSGVSQRTFLLLLHTDSTYSRGDPPKANKELEREYYGWAKGLGSKTFVTSNKLALNDGAWLGPPGMPAALRHCGDGLGASCSPPGDRIDGFFVIRAKDLAEAQQLAATCPHIKHGGRIEVREIDTT